MASSFKNGSRIQLGFVVFFLAFTLPLFAARQPFDHSAWDQFLKKYVNADGQFNYAAAQKDPALLTQYLDQIGKLSDENVNQYWPREERLALWLNLYHAGIVKSIVEHYPLKSIQDIPGVWQIGVVRMKNHSFSLEDIQRRQLMEIFRDEKIHAALACSAKSCPQFPREAFTGPRVEGQLFLAAREFVNNPDFNQIMPGEKNVHLSRIFKWYTKDFNLDFGSSDNPNQFNREDMAILSFIAYYLDDPAKVEYLEEAHYKIKYLSFDWALSEWR
jgi:hypothetical protein